MAGETLFSNAVTLSAAIESKMLPWFTSNTFMPKVVAGFSVDVPNTRAKTLPKSGSLTASVVAENAAATAQTITDSSVTLTLQKAAVLTTISIEALKFASGANTDRHAQLAAQACAKKFDTDALALASGLSQSVDSSTTLTVAKLQEAAYTVRLGDIPSDNLVSVLSYKQAYQIGNDIRTSTGAFFGNPNFNAGSATNGNTNSGFVTNLFGIDIYQTSNVGIDTVATPDDFMGVVLAKDFAIAALYPNGASAPTFEVEIDPSVDFKLGLVSVRTYMWYQLAEYHDAAGVRLLSDI